MKKILSLFLISYVAISFGQVNVSALFIGNSYTSYNNLTNLVQSLATADGNTLVVDSYAPGGYKFSQHSSDATTLAKISARDWDFVILQEQSQLPSFPDGQVATDVYPYAEILVNKIRENNPCSIPLFYDTWGRKNGDSQWVGINTFEKMNERLLNAYTKMTEDAQGMMAPAGVAYEVIKNDPNAVVVFDELYVADESHPMIMGSYLVACIFNNLLFSTSSVGNAFIPSGINSAQATYLQGIADDVCRGIVRLDYRPLSMNDFTFETNGNEVSFTAQLSGGQLESWSYGDGMTSTDLNPTHVYTENGIFSVTMNTKTDCYISSVTNEISVTTVGLNEVIASENGKVYPNPSRDGLIFIDYQLNEDYVIYDLRGKQVKAGKSKAIQLDKGVYIFQYQDFFQKIIVE